MRPPPPVAAVLHDDPLWRVARCGLPAVAVLVLLGWIAGLASESPWGWVVPVCVAVCAGLWVDRCWRPAPIELGWDGAAWQCRLASSDDRLLRACPVRPAVQLDLGPWMLLRLHRLAAECRTGCPRWVAVSRRGAGTAWTGLRVALYCAPLGPPTRPGGG
jgi:hypothetical protein